MDPTACLKEARDKGGYAICGDVAWSYSHDAEGRSDLFFMYNSYIRDEDDGTWRRCSGFDDQHTAIIGRENDSWQHLAHLPKARRRKNNGNN